MTMEIKEIEEMLQLCIDMDSPSIVIPVSEIEKYFPSPRLAIDPSKPCYDLGKLKAWAGKKEWSVSFATTPAANGKCILPAIRFTPLSKINNTPNPIINNSDAEHDWHNKPIGQIGIGVIIVILGAMAIYIFKTHFGVSL